MLIHLLFNVWKGIADIQYSNLDTALTKEILIQWPKLLPLIPQLIQIWY